MVCKLQKLMFQYEWFDRHKKSDLRPDGFEDFYCSLKTIIAKDEYEQFLKMFKENDCTPMGD